MVDKAIDLYFSLNILPIMMTKRFQIANLQAEDLPVGVYGFEDFSEGSVSDFLKKFELICGHQIVTLALCSVHFIIN